MKRVIMLLLTVAGIASAQALGEYGTMTARSANTAAAAGAAGKSAGKLLGNLGKTLDQAAGQAAPSSAVPAMPAAKSTAAAVVTPNMVAAAAPAVAPVPAVAATPAVKEPPAPPADLSLIIAGMERRELIEKVGKPSMSMSGMESSVIVETCWYKSGGETVVVTLRDNKVASIAK